MCKKHWQWTMYGACSDDIMKYFQNVLCNIPRMCKHDKFWQAFHHIFNKHYHNRLFTKDIHNWHEISHHWLAECITSFVTKEECIQKRGTVASIIAGCSQRTHMHSIRYYKVWIKTYSQDMGMSSGFLQHLKELFSLCINLYALSLPLFFWPVLLLQLHQQQHLFGRLEWLL